MTAVKPALKIATFIMLIWAFLTGLTALLADWSTEGVYLETEPGIGYRFLDRR